MRYARPLHHLRPLLCTRSDNVSFVRLTGIRQAVGAQWELPGGVGVQWELPEACARSRGIPRRRALWPDGDLRSSNRPFSCLIPVWMAQSAVVRDYRALEVGRRRANPFSSL